MAKGFRPVPSEQRDGVSIEREPHVSGGQSELDRQRRGRFANRRG
jgi:hypothetical protein